MKKGTFFEKGAPKISPSPYLISLLSVLHQNKALHNFRKRGQRWIDECNIGLEYALVISVKYQFTQISTLKIFNQYLTNINQYILETNIIGKIS